jgi:hypothetical protein
MLKRTGSPDLGPARGTSARCRQPVKVIRWAERAGLDKWTNFCTEFCTGPTPAPVLLMALFPFIFAPDFSNIQDVRR